MTRKEARYRVDVAVCWEKGRRTRSGTPVLHAARWLFGAGRHSAFACGKSRDAVGLVDWYANAAWHVQPNNVHVWCERCRSAAIAALGDAKSPYSNTGIKVGGGE